MQLKDLIILSDFILVLDSIRKHPTKNEYFFKYIIFSIIYLLQEQKLNPINYFEQQINMINFVEANDYDMLMYENFVGLDFYAVL
jgi:hypothetical protein